MEFPTETPQEALGPGSSWGKRDAFPEPVMPPEIQVENLLWEASLGLLKAQTLRVTGGGYTWFSPVHSNIIPKCGHEAPHEPETSVTLSLNL